MANIHDDPAALKALQDDIYRERILRARRMTVEQRLAEVFEISNNFFAQMHARAMSQLGTTEAELGWKIVRRWMRRLDRVRNRGFFVTKKPTVHGRGATGRR